MRVLVTGGAGFIGVVATSSTRADDVLVVDSQDPANALPGATYKQLCLPCAESGRRSKNFVPKSVSTALVELRLLHQLKILRQTLRMASTERLRCWMRYAERRKRARSYFSQVLLCTEIRTRCQFRKSAPIAPLSPYGYHKAIAELLCREHTTVYGYQHYRCVSFPAYGVGLQRQVLWDTSRKLLNSDVIELFGTGVEETRDFIHVTDVARAVWHLVKHGTFDGGAYNLAGGEAVSIASLARALACQLHPTASIKFTGVRPSGDPAQWQADVQKLRATGFHWSVDWEAGLREYATWVRGGCL